MIFPTLYNMSSPILSFEDLFKLLKAALYCFMAVSAPFNHWHSTAFYCLLSSAENEVSREKRQLASTAAMFWCPMSMCASIIEAQHVVTQSTVVLTGPADRPCAISPKAFHVLAWLFWVSHYKPHNRILISPSTGRSPLSCWNDRGQ